MKKISTKLFLMLAFVLGLNLASKAVCVANFTFTVAGNVVTFVNTSTGFGSNTIWSWNFGDTQTSASQNPTPHTYALPGTYTVCLGGADPIASCLDSACHVFTIAPSGIAEFNQINGNISNYPNPFSGSTTIRYITGEVGSLDISVYDVLGNKVATVENTTTQTVGKHEILFDAAELSQGIYFLRFTLNGRSVTEKMTVTN